MVKESARASHPTNGVGRIKKEARAGALWKMRRKLLVKPIEPFGVNRFAVFLIESRALGWVGNARKLRCERAGIPKRRRLCGLYFGQPRHCCLEQCCGLFRDDFASMRAVKRGSLFLWQRLKEITGEAWEIAEPILRKIEETATAEAKRWQNTEAEQHARYNLDYKSPSLLVRTLHQIGERLVSTRKPTGFPSAPSTILAGIINL